jgi:hypothetical protein
MTVAVLSSATLLNGLPGVLLFTGWRFLVLAVLFNVLNRLPREELAILIAKIERWCRPFFMLQLLSGVYEIRLAPQVFGATSFGGRAFGLFTSPNNLGLAVVGFLVLRWILGRRSWFDIALVVLGIATGSRTTVLCLLALIVLASCLRLRGRGLLYYPFILIGYVVYKVASSAAVSGRVIDDSQGRQRLWFDIVKSLSPRELIFGQGVGLGSNATQTVYGTNASALGAKITDGLLISVTISFGFVGIAWTLFIIQRLISGSDERGRFVVLPVVLLGCLTFNLAELAPENLFLLMALCIARQVPDVRPANVDAVRRRSAKSPPRSFVSRHGNAEPMA